jgi:hypothetical protein
MKRIARSSLKGAAFVMFLGTAAHSLPLWPHQRAELFATCVGRLEALALDHSNATARNVDALRDQRADFQMLLDATLPAALDEGVPQKMPKLWRAGGWSEVTHLLGEMQYSVDSGRVDRARVQLERRILECEKVLLS